MLQKEKKAQQQRIRVWRKKVLEILGKMIALYIVLSCYKHNLKAFGNDRVIEREEKGSIP